jgi:hypothetical protein
MHQQQLSCQAYGGESLTRPHRQQQQQQPDLPNPSPEKHYWRLLYAFFCICMQQVAAYENLLRKIIIKAPHAALLSFAVYAWKIDEVGNRPPYTRVPNPFWNTGGLLQHTMCMCTVVKSP